MKVLIIDESYLLPTYVDGKGGLRLRYAWFSHVTERDGGIVHKHDYFSA